ncbi:MAG: hypothetical protein IKR90_02050 [Clostridia bacterium]|nr:hypothetical protein [Clostridia bacterium]
MKMRKLSKSVIALMLAVCLAFCAFCPASFALCPVDTEAIRNDTLSAYKGGGFYIFHLNKKYVKQGDKVTVLAKRYENGKEDYVAIPESNFLVKKEKTDNVEYFAIYVWDEVRNNSFRIGGNSFYDAEGNGNEEIIPPINMNTHKNYTENMFSFIKHEGPVFYDVNFTKDFNRGDSIRVELHGTMCKNYKVYLGGKLISTGKEEFDVKFTEPGKQVFKVYLNDIIQDELTFNITDSDTASKDKMDTGLAQMGESIKLFPAGVLLSLNPITMIMGGAILGGFWEGLWNIICSIFGW